MRKFYFPTRTRRVTGRRFAGLEHLEDRCTPATFTQMSPQTFTGVNNNNGCVVAGDFDKDGNQDLVLANYGASSSNAGQSISVLFGTGTGTFVSGINYEADTSNNDHVSFVAVGDLNGDDWLDIVSVQSHLTGNADSTYTAFMNTKLGTFVAKPAVASGGNNATWVGIADFDSDGIPDIGITHMGQPFGGNQILGNNIGLFKGNNDGSNKGDGTFSLSQQIATDFQLIPTAGLFVDITGDTEADLVVAIPTANLETTVDQTPGKLGLVLNDGAGVYSMSSTYPVSGGPLPISIAAADLDGNGAQDLLVANAGNPDSDNNYANWGGGTNFGYLMGDGFGGFATAKIMTSGIRCAFGVVSGDFNADTKQDAAIVSYGRPLGLNGSTIIFPEPGALVVYHGNGAGAFSVDTGSPYTDTNEGNQYLAAGQFNNSGGPDIVTVGDHNRVRMHLNGSTPNTPPNISDIVDVTGSSGTLSGPHKFTVGDAETPVGSLTLSAKSSNTTVMPVGNITFGGSGADRDVSLQVPVGVSGTSTITITVTDGGGITASDTFTISVDPNTAPGISDIGDVKVSAGGSVAPINFGIGDNESAATSLVVTAKSSNSFIVPDAKIVLGGTGSVRTIGISQVGAFPGTSTITVRVTDPGGLFAEDTFVVTVTSGASVTSIDSTSPNGTYTTGQTINVRVNFSELVTLSGGNLNVALDSGGTVTIAPFSGTSAIGVYTVAAGQTSPDLNVTGLSLGGGATLVNGGGAPASLTLPGSNLANNANLIVNPPPPTTVTSFSVNGGDSQRSRITTVTITFNNPINAADFNVAGAITLTRTKATSTGTVGTIVQTGATGANGRITIAPATGTTTSLTLTFDNANGASVSPGVENNSLSDGRWRISIPSIGYQSTLDDPALRRLFGDFDGNGTVDGVDFGSFGAVFGQTNSTFDFDGNGTVDSVDLAQLGNRFGISL